MLSEHKRSRRQSAEAEVKAEAENARREVNKALSAQQLMIKRNWTKKQNELKDKLFAEVQNLLEDFVKTPEYDSYLCRKIKDAQDFAGEDELHIYLTPSDSSRLESISQKTGAALRLADEEFIGGIRAIIPGKNILIDNSFREAFLACKKNLSLTEVQDMSKTGIIYGINGPVIYLKGDCGFKISEMVYVGPEKLVGEVIGLKKA